MYFSRIQPYCGVSRESATIIITCTILSVLQATSIICSTVTWPFRPENLSQCLHSSKDPQKALCLYEGRSDHGKKHCFDPASVVPWWFLKVCKLKCGKRKKKKKKSNLWKCFLKVTVRQKYLGGASFLQAVQMFTTFQMLFQAYKCYRHFRGSTLYTYNIYIWCRHILYQVSEKKQRYKLVLYIF